MKQQVVISLLTAAAVGAAERLKGVNHPGVKLAGIAMAAAAPGVATHAARQVGKTTEQRQTKRPSGEKTDGSGGGGTEPVGQADDAGKADTAVDLPSYELEPALLTEFADALGIRQPPDPEELYRDGSEILEPLYPLPEGLAALPWPSLSRRNRFFVLVAAWALREADGIQLVKQAQLDDAREIFRECAVRAEHMQSPELVARSYEDLGELAAVSGDEAAARKWRAEAERVLGRAADGVT